LKHTSVPFAFGGLALGLLLSCGLGGCGSDDDSGTASNGAGGQGAGGQGAGGQGSGGEGGGASGTVATQFWTSFDMSKPEGVNGALGPLFNAALQDRTIMMLIQRDDTGADGPVVRTGSAKVVVGADTEDPTDDVFDFNLASTCSDAAGVEQACDIEVGTATIADDADGYHTTEKTLINAYSSKFKMVVRMREVDLTVTTADCDFDLCATFKGAVTTTDASSTIFEVTTGDPASRTDLKTFMENFGNLPDTMIPNAAGEMEAAWTFEGTFTADEVEFKAD
jgi:hypothetical protein